MAHALSEAGAAVTVASRTRSELDSFVAEAEAALQSLGYKPAEAQKMVSAVTADFTECADIIRAALKSMMK